MVSTGSYSLQSSSVTFLWLLQLAIVPTVARCSLAFLWQITDFHATGNCPPRLENDLHYNAKDGSVKQTVHGFHFAEFFIFRTQTSQLCAYPVRCNGKPSITHFFNISSS